MPHRIQDDSWEGFPDWCECGACGECSSYEIEETVHFAKLRDGAPYGDAEQH